MMFCTRLSRTGVQFIKHPKSGYPEHSVFKQFSNCATVQLRKILLGLLCFFSVPLWACTVVDDAKQRLTLTQPARRIITLSPDLTELVFALGADKALVGVIAGSDYPQAAQRVPRVGDFRALDVERILALHPDLILAWGESQVRQVEELKERKLPVFISHSRHLVDIPDTMRRLGCLTGKEKRATVLTQNFFKRYARLKRGYHRAIPVRVFYQLASRPLMTINRESWINDAIVLCGGNNIFAQTGISGPFKQTAFAVSLEAVLAANPELVVADLPQGWQQNWQSWSSVAAVQGRHLVTINPDQIERAGPRILDGVEELCRAVSSVAKVQTG